jgi:hypothetical protein
VTKRTSPGSLLCLFLFTALPCALWGQASINEGLETAFIYISPTGSDGNGNGTLKNPYQTINKGVTVAVANNQAGIGTQVNIEPGTYRESIDMYASVRNTTLPITFQAVTNGTVIISGATVMTGWTEYSANHKIYTTDWTYNFGTCAQVSGCPAVQSIVLQHEMLVVNGTVMTQVLSIAELEPGSFYVDQSAGTVYLYPPSGTDVATSTIETATQPALWTLSGESYIVLRGLTFEYANSCQNSAAVQVGGAASNVLLDTLTIQWNNGQGLSISNPFTNFTVQNTTANHNGIAGFQEFQTLNGLWTNNTAEFNNWRGAQGGYYACNLGGIHPYQAHVDTINGMTLAYNQTYGVHWDTDNANITVSNLVSTNNLVGAIFSEKNEGPLSISSSHLCNGNAVMGGAGLAIRNSTGVSFTNGTIVNNPPAQIDVFGQPGGIEITNWQTGQTINLITSNFTNTGNVIQGDGTSQYVFEDATLGGSDWNTFESSFVSNNNTWWNSSNSTTPFVVPTPAYDTQLDLSGWTSTTGQDSSSKFEAPKSNPASACNPIVPDMPDYWLSIDNTALTLNPIGQATFNLTATPLDFTGTLSLLLDGLQGLTGMSSSFSPTTIPLSGGVAGTSALTITGLTTAPAGTYPVTIVANNGNLTRMVTAQVTVPAPGFRLSTILLAFGNQQTGTSTSQQVTLTNNAKTSTNITSIVSNLTVFTETNTCGTKLGAGKSCTVTVTFDPTFIGTFTGTLTFTDADLTSPQVVTLTGTGTAPPTATLLPSSMRFGTVTVGTTSASTTSTLTNTSLTAALNITSITLTGSNPGDFQITKASTCPNSGTINPLKTCLITVTFTPTETGSRSATLTVNDNTKTGTQTISLSGTGQAADPTATLLPATLNFGSITVGSTSSAQSSTLTDTSTTVALKITSITLTGTNPGDFLITKASTCPNSGTINPLKTCLVTVTFTPTKTGSRSATLTVNDNTSGGKQTIALSGTGK